MGGLGDQGLSGDRYVLAGGCDVSRELEGQLRARVQVISLALGAGVRPVLAPPPQEFPSPLQSLSTSGERGHSPGAGACARETSSFGFCKAL